MDKLYTKAGDNGCASTLTRHNIPKSSPIFDVLGTLDELTCQLGVAKRTAGTIAPILEQLQTDIIAVCGELAGGKKFVDGAKVAQLEGVIDTLCEGDAGFTGFVVSGASACGAALDVARTIARRAERAAVAASQKGGFTKELLAWFNRLSDLLYALARLCDRNAVSKAATPTATTVAVNGSGFCDKALRLCLAVRERAAQMGVRAVTAVCDAGGNPVAMLRADDAFIASVDIAMNKAFTSVSLKMSTDELSLLAQPGQSLYGIQFTNGNRIVVFGGGVPLTDGDLIIGGFGVSGGTAEQDTALGEFAREYYEKELR